MSDIALREDSSRMPAGFGLAVVLHGLLFAWLAYYFWAHPAHLDGAPHVFELVAPPSPTPGNSAPVKTAQAPTPTLKATAIADLPTIKPVTVPETSPPAATSPARASQPKPAPSAVAPETTAKTDIAASTTKAAPATVTYEQFISRNGPPKPSTNTNPARGPTRAVPQVAVDSSGIIKELQNSAGQPGNGGQKGSAGTVSKSMLDDYIAGLRERILGAFENPPGLSLTGLKASVRMSVGARGEVSSWQLTRSSGNLLFDEAVRAALKRLTNVAPPPGGAAQTFQFEFQWER